LSTLFFPFSGSQSAPVSVLSFLPFTLPREKDLTRPSVSPVFFYLPLVQSEPLYLPFTPPFKWPTSYDVLILIDTLVAPLLIPLLSMCLPFIPHWCYSSTLKMEAADSPETMVVIYQITWHHIPEDCNLHSPCYENPISYILVCSDILSVVILSRTNPWLLLIRYGGELLDTSQKKDSTHIIHVGDVSDGVSSQSSRLILRDLAVVYRS
jgi:hypothetical protein